MNAPASAPLPSSPNAQDSEKFVIGQLLADGDGLNVVERILKSEMFYAHDHRVIFSAILQNKNSQRGTDPVTIAAALSQHEAITQPRLIDMITQFVGVPGMDLKTHAKAIRDAYSKRQMIAAARTVLEQCYATESKIQDIAQLMQSASAEADLVGQSGRPQTAHMLAEYNATHQQIIDDRASGESNPGVSTGLPDVDKKIIQCNAGWLFVIGASPGTGKTALALNFMDNLLRENFGKRVVIFSVEMPVADIYDRALALRSRVDLTSIRTGKLSTSERQRVADAGFEYERTKVMVDDNGSINTDEIRARCRQYEREHGQIDMVVVDYMQIVRAVGNGEMRSVQVGAIAMELKSLAKEYRAPVIALSQLSRPPKSSPNYEPTMSDLKESGTIEAAADIIALLHQPKEQGENTIKMIIDKNRAGEKGVAWLHFDGARMKFNNQAGPQAEDAYAEYAQYEA